MYFRMSSDSMEMTAFITPISECSKSLILGRPIDVSRQRIPFRYSYMDPECMPLFDYYDSDSLMSDRLVMELEKAGVDNLQKFPAVLVDEVTGAERNDYFVVNVIGIISCADLRMSRSTELGSLYYFHDLIIDPSKAMGCLLFRLAESRMDVIVNDRVARAISDGNFRGIEFSPSEMLN